MGGYTQMAEWPLSPFMRLARRFETAMIASFCVRDQRPTGERATLQINHSIGLRACDQLITGGSEWHIQTVGRWCIKRAMPAASSVGGFCGFTTSADLAFLIA